MLQKIVAISYISKVQSLNNCVYRILATSCWNKLQKATGKRCKLLQGFTSYKKLQEQGISFLQVRCMSYKKSYCIASCWNKLKIRGKTSYSKLQEAYNFVTLLNF